MYWWQSYEQVRQEIKETCEAIRRYGEELRAKGPEACRQFLIDAGIIEKEGPELQNNSQ